MVKTLDIVIVNWNAGRYLDACLNSIRSIGRDGFELKRVVIVDNASSDGSVDGLDQLDLPIFLIRNPENRGFAAACNQGARGSAADYLLFLNPDMRVFVDSLRAPLGFMEEAGNAGVGICGIQLLNNQGKVSPSCSWFPTTPSLLAQMFGLDRIFPSFFPGHYLKESAHLKSGFVDQVMGAFLLIRRTLFETLNEFDERFFVYFEDVDLSYRARLKGWSSYHLGTVQAFHQGRGCSDQAKSTRLFYFLRSRILYVQKHFSLFGSSLITLVTLFVEPFCRLLWAGWRGSHGEIRETLGGYLKLFGALPGILFKGDGRGHAERDEGRPSQPAPGPQNLA
jgi:N-acetylglucosaminyl-diphospho-decaprenol L-rhamnosyltransferase